MDEIFLIQTLDVTVKVILSAALSSIIGMEREYRQKIAGLRTHILVGVGSTLVVLTSIYTFEAYKDSTMMDPTRMAAGVIQGIGFLCAGTIIKAGDNVRGLTTAATLWIVACLGLAVGSGFYTAAVIVTIVVMGVLTLVRLFEAKLANKLDQH